MKLARLGMGRSFALHAPLLFLASLTFLCNCESSDSDTVSTSKVEASEVEASESVTELVPENVADSDRDSNPEVSESRAQAHSSILSRHSNLLSGDNLRLEILFPPVVSDEVLRSSGASNLYKWYLLHLGVELRRPDGSLAYYLSKPSAVIEFSNASPQLCYDFLESPEDAQAVDVYTICLVDKGSIGEVVRFDLTVRDAED